MSIKQPVTAEQLWQMPDKPGVRFELVDGELIEVPGAGALHGLIVALVFRLIDAFARDRNLGLTFSDGTGFVLGRSPDRLRIPDVAFVRWERVPADGVPESFWEGAPDLAVEVVSPHDRADETHERVRDYLAAGASLVWVLWPRCRAVTVHTGDGLARDLGPEAELDGGAVLPGFRVRVADLFAVPRQGQGRAP